MACAVRVGELLRACGAEVTLEEVLPGRPNVIGRFPGGRKNRGILLAPHLDTVSVQGMSIDPFGGEIRDGKIFGRGASDTKGTMAAMLWALFQMRENLSRLSSPVTFVGLMGEEADQPGSKHFAAHHAKPVAGVAPVQKNRTRSRDFHRSHQITPRRRLGSCEPAADMVTTGRQMEGADAKLRGRVLPHSQS